MKYVCSLARVTLPLLLLMSLSSAALAKGWQVPPTTVSLPKERQASWQVEISKNSKLVCVYSWANPWRGVKIFRRIVDMNGSDVDGLVDAQDNMTTYGIEQFSRSIPRTAFTLSPDSPDNSLNKFPFNKFCNGALFGGCDDGLNIGLCQTSKTIELWRIHPEKQMIWRKNYATYNLIEDIAFIRRDDKDLILAAFSGNNALMLSKEDGNTIEKFSYRGNDTKEAISKYATQMGISTTEAKFSAFKISINCNSHLIACGDLTSKRIRCISMDQPYTSVFEANTQDRPLIIGVGSWCVEDISFSPNGNYLTAIYVCAGRGLHPGYRVTEIFETRTWKKIFHVDSRDIVWVCISPDGKKIALIRENRVLEIGDFSACNAAIK